MKRNRDRNRVHLRGGAVGLVSQAGIDLLYRAAAASGLSAALRSELAGFRRARAEHDPGKVVLDLVVMLAAGGDCPADTAMLRAGHGVFGPVASDPTISRLVHRLAAGPEGLAALRRNCVLARARAGGHLTAAGRDLPGEVVVANAVWLQIVLLAQLLTAHLQRLALTGELALAEPKRLRLRVFTVAGRLVRTGRKRILDLDRNWPWTPEILTAAQRLNTFAQAA